MKKILLLSLVLVIPLVGLSKNAPEGKSRFEHLELFNKVLFLIESSYYRDVDTKKLIEGALKGMMNTLDPHTAFLGEENFKKMQSDTAGEFGGLGIEVTSRNGYIYVISPIDDSPAFKAGLKAGDKIVEINGESTIGMTLDEAIEIIKGEPDTKVNLGVIRKSHAGTKHFDLVRKVIENRPVKAQLLENNFAFIRLVQFSKNSGSYILKDLKKLKKQAKGNLKGIVLDLRFNPGGLLDEAVNVSSIFLREGIVVSTEGRDPKSKEVRYVNKKMGKELDLPLIVLINGASASASEIVAGALQDHDRAIVMGTSSFGKGSVQQVAKIDDRNGVKLTIAQYMTPKGRKIQAVGIKPDIIVNQLDDDWEKFQKEENFIREVDLKNHLVATIETKEEKKNRLQREKEERRKRRKTLKMRREAKKQEPDEESFLRRYDPKSDFQVLSAIKFLKAFKVIKDVRKI